MIINFKLKILITTALLISFGCVTNGNAEKSDSTSSQAKHLEASEHKSLELPAIK